MIQTQQDRREALAAWFGNDTRLSPIEERAVRELLNDFPELGPEELRCAIRMAVAQAKNNGCVQPSLYWLRNAMRVIRRDRIIEEEVRREAKVRDQRDSLSEDEEFELVTRTAYERDRMRQQMRARVAEQWGVTEEEYDRWSEIRKRDCAKARRELLFRDDDDED